MVFCGPKQWSAIVQFLAPVERVARQVFEDVTGNDGSAIGDQEQEKELSYRGIRHMM